MDKPGAVQAQPARVSGIILLVIFATELAIMHALNWLSLGLADWAVALIDAVVLTIPIAGAIWWLVVRPMARAQSALAQSEMYNRAVIESALDAIVANDRQGRITEFNLSAERTFGYRREEAIGAKMTDLIVPERLRHMVSEDLASATPQFQGRRIESVALHADGHEFPVELTVQRVDRGGERFHIAFARDISERKQAEEDLRASQGYIQAILDTVIDAIISIDDRGVIQTVNPAAERIFGYSRDEMIGKNVMMLMPEPYASAHDGYLNNYLGTGEKKVIGLGREVVGRRKDGSSFPVDLSVGEIQADGQRMFTGVVRDITRHKKAEEKLNQAHHLLERQKRQLEQVDRAKTEFLAAISHELRTPLNSIIGFADLLHSGAAGELDAQQSECISEIDVAGRQLLTTVNVILDMTKIDSGELLRDRETVDIASTLAEAVQARGTDAAKRGIEVGVEAAPGAGRIEISPQALRQMLDQLLSNAIKFNREGGRVTLHERRASAGEWIEIAVADTGIGIAQEDMARLFQPFVQLDATRARRHSGLGVGLALTRRIAIACGGRVGVESKPGRGSVFTLHLPARQAATEDDIGMAQAAAEA